MGMSRRQVQFQALNPCCSDRSAGEWVHGVCSCWLEVERVLAEEPAPADAKPAAPAAATKAAAASAKAVKVRGSSFLNGFTSNMENIHMSQASDTSPWVIKQ